MSRNTIYEKMPIFYDQVHAILVSYLKKQMPTFGKDGEQIYQKFILSILSRKEKGVAERA